MSVTIRPGTPEDMSAVHQLVYELAVFEKAPEKVITNPEIYQRDGFGDLPFFKTLVAECSKEGIIGLALYFPAYSTWKGKMLYLDDLVVTKNRRGEGIGTRLLQELIDLAHRQDIQIIKWEVLDWNEPAIQFYKKLDAEFDGEWLHVKLQRSRIEALASKKPD